MDEPSNHAAFGERREAVLRSDRKAGNGTGVRVRFHEERRHLPRSRLNPQRDKTPGAIRGGRLFPTVGIDEYGIAGPTVWQHAVGIRGLRRTTRWPFRRRAVWPSLGGAAASGRTHKVGGSLPLPPVASSAVGSSGPLWAAGGPVSRLWSDQEGGCRTVTIAISRGPRRLPLATAM